jgi:hypothetical protein
MHFVKHILKKYFQVFRIRHKYSPATQIALRHLFHFYQLHYKDSDKINLKTAGFRVFSQFEEDGKILFILAVIGIKNSSFIEIGADDGLNSNCANLALNFGFHGLFIDANQSSIERGKYFYKRYPHPHGHKPVFVHSKVTRENINDLIRENGYTGEVDVLSIDIDGNDYWIWDALTIVNPRIVIIETHIIYGDRNIVAPYDSTYSYPGVHPEFHGASPIAMVKLGKSKGYRLAGANQLGFNFIFIREDLGRDVIPEVSTEEVLSHPSAMTTLIDPRVLNMPFVTPIE